MTDTHHDWATAIHDLTTTTGLHIITNPRIGRDGNHLTLHLDNTHIQLPDTAELPTGPFKLACILHTQHGWHTIITAGNTTAEAEDAMKAALVTEWHNSHHIPHPPQRPTIEHLIDAGHALLRNQQ